MKNMQPMTGKREAVVFALLIAASLLLLLSGCQNPMQSPGTAGPGTGTVSLAIAQGLGRTILPELPSGGFDGFKAVFTYDDDYTVYKTRSWAVAFGNIELAAGYWTLVVTGFIGEESAAMSMPLSINVVANQDLSRDVQLFPIEDPDLTGTFAWIITLARGIGLDAIRIYGFGDLDGYPHRLVSPYYDLEGDETEMAPGRYLVVFELSGTGGTLEISEILHIYANLTSTFAPKYPLSVEFPSALLDLITIAWTGTNFGASGIAAGHFALSPLNIVGICDDEDSGNFDEIKAQFAALLYEAGLGFPGNPGDLARLVDAALLGIATGDPAFTNVRAPFDEEYFEELILDMLVNTDAADNVVWNNHTAKVTIGVHTVPVTFVPSRINLPFLQPVRIAVGGNGEIGIEVLNIGPPVAGTTVGFADVVTLDPANAHITITGNIAIGADGTGTSTMGLAVASGAPGGEHEVTIAIGEVNEIFTLIIEAVQDGKPPTRNKVVSAGDAHTVMIRSDGTLWTWGDNANGRTGLGMMTAGGTHIPTQIGHRSDWATVSAGNAHTVAITECGQMWVWGLNTSRQLGFDSTLTGVYTPTRIGHHTAWATVSAGNVHTLAITTEGHLYGWGSSSQGRLGNGQTAGVNINAPMRIGERDDWAVVSTHTGHTMAITTSGHLYGWGNNLWGPIGNGTTSGNYALPVRVMQDRNWATVSAGSQHTVAITECGQMWAWGHNGSGQLGSGDTTDMQSRLPVRIGSHSTWTTVSAASGHTVAITTCGEKWAWGTHGQGRLGNGLTSGFTLIPTQIGGRNDWVAVSTMNSHAMATTECGELWAWGFNALGRLGDDSTTQRPTPVRIIPTTIPDTGSTVIANAAISVTAPVTGVTPVTTATADAGANFTVGTVTWNPAHSPFQGDTAYTATVTLTANAGHVFTDGLATAIINGQAATVTDNTGATLTLALEFPAMETNLVLAAWQFSGNASINNTLETGNTAVRPSSGQQRYDARLQFLTLSGSELTPRALSGTSLGVNVLNAAGGANGGLEGLAGNAWWETAISTTGHADIAVTWRMRSTNTGPRDWRLQYRVGSAGGWNNVGGTIVLPLNPEASTLNAPEQRRFLPSSAEGHERLYLRWLMTSNVSANGGTIAATGTHQINDLVIRFDAESFENDYDELIGMDILAIVKLALGTEN